MMSSGTLWLSLGIVLIVHLETHLTGMSVPVEVNVKDTAVLHCNGTCHGDFSWTYKTNNLEVLKCVQSNCTEGDHFKSRASLSYGKMKHGNVSLILRPAVYNDAGWYEASCDSVMLCRVHLEVFVPTTVNALIQDNVTLPCYARTEKQIADAAVNILWKRNQTVLEVQSGITSYGSGFTQRASVSLSHYRDGDLSLTLSRVTPSDSGVYHCYHKTEESGTPGAVTLTVAARQSVHEKMMGDDMTLDLFSLDQAMVTFTSSEGAEMQVCSVEGSTPTCDPKFNDRVTVRNGSLVLSGLLSSDTGTFTVKDKMGEIMSVNNVTVKGETKRHHYVAVAVFIAFVLTGIGLLHNHGKSQQRRGRVSFTNQQSTVRVDTALLREPASIGLSQEETSRDICKRLDITHTPVEETTPVLVMTTEKQDTSEEESVQLKTE